MRAWIWTFIVFVAAVALALVLRDHNGNVLIVSPPWHISFSLTFGILGVLVSFALLYVLLRLLSWLSGSPERFSLWRTRRAEKRDQQLLQTGWISVLEGRYAQAEKELSKLLNKSRSSTAKVVAGLASAQASQQLGDHQRRDDALHIAQKNAGKDARLQRAYATAAAEMYLEQGQAQAAIELLQPVQDANTRNFQATRVLLRAYKEQNDYERVYELTRLLLRRGAIDKVQGLEYIEYAAAKRIAAASGPEQFKLVWGDLRTEEKHSVLVALAAAQFFTQQEQYDEAAKVLEAALQHHFSPELLNAYANCPASAYERRLGRAEQWLKTHPEDPALLVTLGRLCIIGQIWGQAESYLQRSMAIRNDLRTHALLGQLYDALERQEEAVYHWRIAGLALGALPIMPPSRVLPAADLENDPTLVDAHLLEGSEVKAADIPVAASAVDGTVFEKSV